MVDSDGQAFVRREGQADPTALLLDSLADAWGMGLQAWQVLAGMGASSQSGHPGAVLAALVGAKQSVTKSPEAGRVARRRAWRRRGTATGHGRTDGRYLADARRSMHGRRGQRDALLGYAR